MHTVENHLGFICLTSNLPGTDLITIKVNKIVSIVGHSEHGSVVSTVEDPYWVTETPSEIIGQIQNVNPDLR